MISKEMGIKEIVQKYPQTVPVFQIHGMGCLGCSGAKFELMGLTSASLFEI